MTDHYTPEIGTLELTAEQAATFSDETRNLIIMLLGERPATTSHLADALGKPKGTVGHHLKVLEDLGLIAVVRTRKVRAMTEKYYGRVARTYMFPKLDEEPPEDGGHDFLFEALDEARMPRDDESGITTLRHVRLDPERAAEWHDRFHALAEEFAVQPRSGTTTYGLLLAYYPTDLPVLPEDHEQEDGE